MPPLSAARLPGLSALLLLASLSVSACGGGGGGGGPAPARCGDCAVDPGEACDGADLAGQTCAGLGAGFVGGSLACDATCALVTTACTRPPACGDGVANGGEACDGSDLKGQTCTGLGFAGGALTCTGACALDTAACVPLPTCGDGVANGGEACDGSDLQGQTCAGLGAGYTGGTLACTTGCLFDTAGCTAPAEICGDGDIEPGEACDDGNALDGDGCSHLCQLESDNSGWLAPGGWISEGPP